MARILTPSLLFTFYLPPATAQLKPRGAWRGKLSSSDEFAALKADEIRLEE
jgi:hypothetical protein